ncbi:MAG: hypothetical protein AMJ46_05010 [Latescibacteria bacterium DG_63]|nr:MAG: hypothetical protein AMJ46_05010 [Latescibacteria bacterium DG_63]
MVLLELPLLAEDLTGPEIVRKVSNQMNQETSWGMMKLTIVTTSGKEREFTYEGFTADKGRSTVVKYVSPARVKGQAVLLLNNADDIWSYDPRTDRVRKLATHAKRQKMQGSDFTYEDFGSGNLFVTDFEAERVADEKVGRVTCYKVVLRKKEKSGSTYARVVMWVSKENLVPIRIEYYGTDEPEVSKKGLVQSDIKNIDGVPTAMKAVMHNNLDGTDTKLEILEYRYNLAIEKSRFNQRGFYK